MRRYRRSPQPRHSGADVGEQLLAGAVRTACCVLGLVVADKRFMIILNRGYALNEVLDSLEQRRLDGPLFHAACWLAARCRPSQRGTEAAVAKQVPVDTAELLPWLRHAWRC